MENPELTQWKQLLSCRRLNTLKEGSNERECDIGDVRNPFQRDCDRITYCYPFRRLQDKTQVIPMPVIDFVHTRLTHSLEVATVGRSLGKMLEVYLHREKGYTEIESGSIPSIVAAACLAHDIGNPPFGHSGEDAISEYFKFGKGNDNLLWDYRETIREGGFNYSAFKDVVSECKVRDLQYFEGNAMGFHLLTKYDDGSLNLTCATLGAFAKYPRQSFINGEEVEYSGSEKNVWIKDKVSQKKYGFFQTELDDFKIVAKELGLKFIGDEKTNNYAWARHPLAFLMEAADDICYRIIDLEDGFRIGRINFNDAEKPLLAIAQKGGFEQDVYNSIPSKKPKRKFSYLRAKCIHTLITSCFEVYKHNLSGILDYSFDSDLLGQIGDNEIQNALKEIKNLVKENVYKSDTVLSIEATGFEILGTLIDQYAAASDICFACPPNTRSKRASKIFDLLPEEYRHIDDDEEIYCRYLKIAQYVSGMTDTFAMDLYKRIKGIKH